MSFIDGRDYMPVRSRRSQRSFATPVALAALSAALLVSLAFNGFQYAHRHLPIVIDARALLAPPEVKPESLHNWGADGQWCDTIENRYCAHSTLAR